MENQKSFTITKKIAKHGSQSIIVIPRLLEQRLSPGTVVKVVFEIIFDNSEGTTHRQNSNELEEYP